MALRVLFFLSQQIAGNLNISIAMVMIIFFLEYPLLLPAFLLKIILACGSNSQILINRGSSNLQLIGSEKCGMLLVEGMYRATGKYYISYYKVVREHLCPIPR